MVDWFEIALKIGGLVALLAVTVYVTKANAHTLKTEVLPELKAIKIDLAAINLHINSVIDLKKRFDEDHDKIVVLSEKHTGLQLGVNTIRRDVKEITSRYHSKS